MIIKENTSLSSAVVSIEKQNTVASRARDYLKFIKLRLSVIVVFSAVAGYMIGAGTVNWIQVLLLVTGGFLVTASSNGFNQIIEKESDALMSRTADRPLPQGRMTLMQAYVLASIMGIVGIVILWVFMNPLSGILGGLALVLYTLAYTPLKKKTPFAVFVGAFPGAIPPLLGWVAATGQLGFEAWVLFFIQFIWQFPHFWAIAWVLDDDYKKAGFLMLPSLGGRDSRSSFQVLLYTLVLIPISLLPFLFQMAGPVSAAVIALCGVFFLGQAVKLHMTGSLKAATQLMFSSFLYLPVVQIALILDRI